ncbi:MAG: diguanylate cyclase (GGDEF)-like protein [Sulfurimonas sp.]|jgi:diguanylate cyclase (GGDEF)-like protein|uniref:sensor domain-containing diguanylate cyclase n=1 Tax=Sulfurimonas sp. TaxID=2022749 RepID=UPI0039E377BE
MKANYKIVFFIPLLMVILSLSITVINHIISLNNAEHQLKTQSLPLSIDNIYTDIQKHIIEPYLVSSMMANDTFVKDWLINGEEDSLKIQKYLHSIKNKYEMFSTFLVSEKLKNYYTQNGFVEKISKSNPHNSWYFDFKDSQKSHEINLDFNENLTNTMMMFVNYKIYDHEYQLIGATGIALRISYINDMLKRFRQKHNLKVTFYDENGNVVLAEKAFNGNANLVDNKNLKKLKDKIISKSSNLIEYKDQGESYLIKTKFIPELNLYLSVEAKISNLTKDLQKVFYFNLFFSLLITLVITSFILFIVRVNNKKILYLAEFDTLTEIMNRRVFKEKCEYFLLLLKRDEKKLSFIFLDIDDFKNINDKFGHSTGDEVLKLFASIIKTHLRGTDLVGRWGGEEFTILLIDCNLEEAKIRTEKLKQTIENNRGLQYLAKSNITASFGVTEVTINDNIDTIIQRADNAMYISKEEGKNKVTII